MECQIGYEMPRGYEMSGHHATKQYIVTMLPNNIFNTVYKI